jgi:hypothetical protein
MHVANLQYATHNRKMGLLIDSNTFGHRYAKCAGRPYCSGLGYLINFRTLKAIGPHTALCLHDSVSNHSDTEVGRCVQKHTNAACEASPAFVFKQVYYQQDGASPSFCLSFGFPFAFLVALLSLFPFPLAHFIIICSSPSGGSRVQPTSHSSLRSIVQPAI